MQNEPFLRSLLPSRKGRQVPGDEPHGGRWAAEGGQALPSEQGKACFLAEGPWAPARGLQMSPCD